MSARDDAEPNFAVLDIVISLVPDDQRAEGIVHEVRRYTDGHYTFGVAPVDTNDEALGGYYATEQLEATSRRGTVGHFWTEPQMARRIVTVAENYPEEKLRGWFGVIQSEMESGDIYAVEFEFLSAKGPKMRTKHRDIGRRFLRPTDHRIPPEPLPRPVRTLRPGHGRRNLRPTHDCDIVDELDHYL